MARPRKHNQHLPASVRFKHGAYYLVQKGKWTRLGNTLPAEYRQQDRRPDTDMTRLIDAAMAEIYPHVKPGTRRNYRAAVKYIKEAFAEFTPAQVTQADVWDFRRQFGLIPIMGNTTLAVLFEVFKYATRERIVLNNPVIGVDRYARKPRERLLEQHEYAAIYGKAGATLQCIMDLLYLTGQRVNDVIRLSRAQIGDEGVYFRQEKTGKKVLIQWNDELRAAIERAKSLAGVVPTIHLFTTRGRHPLGITQVRTLWQQACKDAGVCDAQLRDLRAMSLTEVEARDGEEAAMRLAAHSTLAVTRGYLRRKKVLKVAGPTRLKPLSQTVSNSDAKDS
jgi:integrase